MRALCNCFCLLIQTKPQVISLSLIPWALCKLKSIRFTCSISSLRLEFPKAHGQLNSWRGVMPCKCFAQPFCLGLILTLCLPERVKLRIFLLSPGQCRYWGWKLDQGIRELRLRLRFSNLSLPLFGSVFKGLKPEQKQASNAWSCMAVFWQEVQILLLGVFYGGIMRGAEYLHLLIWGSEVGQWPPLLLL